MSPTNWKVPTDWVSRGSITGGSHAEARVSVPPRLAGLVLAAIQSGYAEVAADGAAGPGARDERRRGDAAHCRTLQEFTSGHTSGHRGSPSQSVDTASEG